MEMQKKKIEIYDTTLRDGSQGESVFFTLQDKIKIAEKLDEYGFDFIEGGWPGSNPKDLLFFQRMPTKKFSRSKLVAFGSTCRKSVVPEQDRNLRYLVESGAEYITIFGKSWDLHVEQVLRTALEENVRLIRDSIRFLIRQGKHVFFDAEHFFDGYRRNPSYAMETLLAAQDGGAERIILCDTNGGSLPHDVEEAVRQVRKHINVPIGIHTHNDSGLAVANTLAAVNAGAVQVHGTINGFGERCGNADLTTIIPVLQLKMGYACLDEGKLAHLTGLSRYVFEVANIVPPGTQPFVGMSAFTHKGGVHVDAVGKNPETYEHINPEAVGNQRRVLISELSGKSTILQKLRKYDIASKPDLIKKILDMVGELENEGYHFEAAEGSFDLMVRRALGKYRELFRVEGFRVIVEERGNRVVSEATVKVKVGKQVEHTASEGNGPVNALDNALRKALVKFYPCLGNLKLTDYKVRILHPEKATGAVTRVLIESADDTSTWGTIGLSENIIEASWHALVDSFEYKLLKDNNL